jgi:hypothetical protein
MPHFEALSPNVEVIGRAILATIAGLEKDIHPLLEEHGISEIHPNDWYPQQLWLDVLEAISEGWGSRGAIMDLVSVGMRIPDNVLWPPEVDNVEAALFSIDVAYKMNHRGGEIGSYAAQKAEGRHIRMTCDNPYPSDMDYGIIYRTTQKFLARGQHFSVERLPSPCRNNGDDRCIYDIIWT